MCLGIQFFRISFRNNTNVAPIRKRSVKSEGHILSSPVETEYDGSELSRSGGDYLGSSAKAS